MRQRVRSLMVAATATALVMTAAGPGQATAPAAPAQTVTSPAAPVTTASYSGETIYRGLFLAQGPVAELFPERTAAVDVAAPANQEEVTNALVDGIQAADPTFFDGFAETMTSGNPVLVDQALRTATELTGEVLTDLYGEAAAAPNGEINAFTIGNLVALVNLAVGVAVAVTVYVWLGSSPQESLDDEREVDIITTRLAAR